MIRWGFAVGVGVFCKVNTQAQCMMEEVELSQRIATSTMIVEGRVIEQLSFWNDDTTNIYTAHLIEVYKVLKGRQKLQQIELITPGGIVGREMEIVQPALQLSSEEIGVFMLEALDKSNVRSYKITRTPFQTVNSSAYTAVASTQGFIRYDETLGIARDVFRIYRNVGRDLYQSITQQTNQFPLQIQSYELTTQVPAIKRSRPSIRSFSPTSASGGTEEVLTINGTHFGERGNNSAIFFKNPDNGGGSFNQAPNSNIVSWSDTQIKVKIPTSAGSGQIRIRHQDNQIGLSANNLTITYAQYTVFYDNLMRSVHLANDNGSGGYTLQYGISTSHNGVDFREEAQAPFERALKSWSCNTGFNIRKGGTTMLQTASASTAPNIIMFDNDQAPLPTGILGRTYSGFTSCDGETWYLKGFDIVFNRNISWNFTENDPCDWCFDMESVALHELGHAHLMGHVINSDHVMHFAIGNSWNKRKLDESSAIHGGNAIIATSQEQELCFGLTRPMSRQTADCPPEIEIPLDPYLQAKVLLEGFYVTQHGEMHTHLQELGLIPPTQPFARAPFNYTGDEKVTSFTPDIADWILVELRSGVGSETAVARKACLLRKDGQILDIEGNLQLRFGELDTGKYYLVIFHPRHLAVLSNNKISYYNEGEMYDFTSGMQQAMGENQLKSMGGKYAMFGGDFDGNGKIDRDDFENWQTQSATINQYLTVDGDGSGTVNIHDINIWARNREKEGHESLK